MATPRVVGCQERHYVLQGESPGPGYVAGQGHLPGSFLPPNFAQCQFDMRELLPEGLVHVLFEVCRLHVLYNCGL